MVFGKINLLNLDVSRLSGANPLRPKQPFGRLGEHRARLGDSSPTHITPKPPETSDFPSKPLAGRKVVAQAFPQSAPGAPQETSDEEDISAKLSIPPHLMRRKAGGGGNGANRP